MPGKQHALEVYFAKRYTDHYVRFGGQWTPFGSFPISAMQHYFISGGYRELDDPELEKLWVAARRELLLRWVLVSAFFFGFLWILKPGIIGDIINGNRSFGQRLGNRL